MKSFVSNMRRWTVLLALLVAAAAAAAGDWPQQGCDAGRTAQTDAALPEKLHLQWVRHLPQPRAAWPKSQFKLQFDASYEPVVMGKSMFVASMVRDSVTAYDTDTGKEKWRYYAAGPVRFAPVAYEGRVAFASDDGCLYCVDASTGKLVWKVKGGPDGRKVIGNDRLIGMWPARGGPVLRDGTIYFGAGIWPFMGTFIHAVDARTGKVVWTNSATGSIWMNQPHGGAVSFSGVTAQGYMAATEDRLIVPTGRSVPAVFDRTTGEMAFFHLAGGGKSGGCEVSVAGESYYNRGGIYSLATGKGHAGPRGFCTADGVYAMRGDNLTVTSLKVKTMTVRDRRGRKRKVATFARLWKAELAPAPETILLKAGNRFYGAAKDGTIVAVEVAPAGRARSRAVGKVEGKVWRMLAADSKLFAVTLEGRIYCFGAGQRKAETYLCPKIELQAAGDAWPAKAKAILAACGETEGYCVALGLGSGRLVEELIKQSGLHVIVIDAEEGKVDAFRRRMDAAGLYGERVAVLVGDPLACELPPYLAHLIVSEDIAAAGLDMEKVSPVSIFRPLRPYGGTACLPLPANQRSWFSKWIAAGRLHGAEVKPSGEWTLLRRVGALKGAGQWTHNYADAGNSVVSSDTRVKTPLGLLWFGGPPNDPILPRHGHGPSPQVVGGRLLIEGQHLMRCVDVYTGRLIWEKPMKDIGYYYRHTGHHPGAGEIGSNYVSLADGVYVASPDACYRLDPATGKTVQTFTLPARGGGGAAKWGFVSAWGDLLVATASPVAVVLPPAGMPADAKSLIAWNAEWQYLAGAHPKGEWTGGEFDAKGWRTGAAGFGYGRRGIKTVLKDMKDKYTTVYIRKTFDLADPSEIGQVTLLINYDDAFIAYLNGKEVVRAGVGGGRGASATKIRSHEAKRHSPFVIERAADLLRKGRNVLAIEGHNVSASSSDFVLDPFLAAALKPPAGKAALNDIPGVTVDARYAASSKTLVVMDRHSGTVLWSRDAVYNFRHNGIAIADGKVFCIDSMTAKKLAYVKRRGLAQRHEPTLYALDARTGRVVWKTDENVFGTWLGYSARHDVLVQAGSRNRDRASDDVGKGIVVYRAKTGKVVWRDLAMAYGGPLMLWRDEIITNGSSGEGRDLLSGKPTGWKWSRKYGCNTAIASEHLLTFRSGAAGYYDLANRGGTGNLGGFKSSCTSNLIVADGVLSAPDYTRTCSCSYQNQCSLAVIHMPDAEMWTYGGQPSKAGRLGLNFGAPGDRLAEGGTTWLEYPVVGGPSPKLPVKIKGQVKYFRHHSLLFAGRATWVAASGLQGDCELTIRPPQPSDGEAKARTVRLVFAEPIAGAEAGSRIFDVMLQGKAVLRDFDIVRAAGGPRRTVVKELKVAPAEEVKIVLKAKTGQPVLCGVEIVPDGG